MGVPFGFSVGDIVAGIGAIKTSIEAFSNTRGASKEYKLLSDTLARLCESLELIGKIEVDTVYDATQRQAITRAAKQCQYCIDYFLNRIAKYKIIQLGREPKHWSEKLEGAARKIQWALCKQNDITKFRADVQVQLEALSMLLVTLQIHRGSREAGLQEVHRREDGVYREVLVETRSAVQQANTFLSQQASTFDSITNNQAEILSLSRTHLSTLRDTEVICNTNYRHLRSQRNALEHLQTENGRILERTEEQLSTAQSTQDMVRELQGCMSRDQRAMLQQILQQQARNFQLIIDQQAQNHQLLLNELHAVSAHVQLQNNIPPQVLLQQPVVFKDALDRVTPVHLEFIDSAEAFVAVLKVRFKDIGLEKLERNEFLLSDERQNRDLDICKPWHAVMKPGQHVSMRMVFNTDFQLKSCPGCLSENSAGKDQETVCSNCGLTYRLVEEELAQPVIINQQRGSLRQRYQSDDRISAEGFTEMGRLTSTPEATIADFRRVHLINWTATYHYKCTFPDCSGSFSNDEDRKRHELHEHRRNATTQMAGVEATDSFSTPSDTTTPQNSAEIAEAVANLESMGFERAEIDTAMRAALYNPDRAVEFLLNGIPEEFRQTRRSQPSQTDVFAAAPPPGLGTSTTRTDGLPGTLGWLRDNAQFRQLRQVVQLQPQMLEPILQQISIGNPQFGELLGQNPDEFLQLLGEDDAADDDNAPLPAGATPVHVTDEEREAIERLCRLGFDRNSVIYAYFACDKNEELAANFLFEQPDDEEFEEDAY